MKINEKLGILIIVIFLITLVIFSINNINKEIQQEKILLGYCPTMKENAEQISKENNQIILIEKSSSAHALYDLNNGKIDIALVGRTAKNSEIQNAKEKVLGSGYTLISTEKKYIEQAELPNIRVHTALEEKIVRKILPNTELLFYNSQQEAELNGLKEAVLINWIDFKEKHELIVVMDGTDKVKEFRIPVLYSLNHDLTEYKI